MKKYGRRKGSRRKGSGKGKYKYGVRIRGRGKRIKRYGVSRGGIRL